MKAISGAGLAVLMALVLGCFLATEARGSDLSDLYNKAKDTLGSKDRIILASGPSRLVVWKSESPNELMLMSITGLYRKPENFSSSFLAYSLTDGGMFSSKIYQCSWREENKKVVYECGETMKFPAGVREAASNELMRELDTVLRTSDQPVTKELTSVRSR
jgi:hypothetical protein